VHINVKRIKHKIRICYPVIINSYHALVLYQLKHHGRAQYTKRSGHASD